MKKRTLALIIVILLVLVSLAIGSNNEQSSITEEVSDINTIKVGKYIGQLYKITSSFLPVLTLENNGRFRFELAINKTIEGSYRIENNKLILTSGGNEDYTLDISNDMLVIEQEVPSYVKKGTRFKLPAGE